MPSFHDVSLEVLGRQLQVSTSINNEDINKAVAILESVFYDMERAYEEKWGMTPSAFDTSSWLLMGALNIAHKVLRLEKNDHNDLVTKHSKIDVE